MVAREHLISISTALRKKLHMHSVELPAKKIGKNEQSKTMKGWDVSKRARFHLKLSCSKRYTITEPAKHGFQVCTGPGRPFQSHHSCCKGKVVSGRAVKLIVPGLETE